MTKVAIKLALVAGMGLAAAACQNDAYGPPSGYQPAPAYYNNGYYSPPPPRPQYYAQPAPNYYYAPPPQRPAYYANQGNYGGPRYTTVTVTNRGQNGYRDQVVQQQVPCGSQYFDGYTNRYAPTC